MSFFPNLDENTHLTDVFRGFPQGIQPLLELHDAILREPSPLSVADRELMAAFVSGLNQCQFCFNAHTVVAEVFGVDPRLFDELIEDIETSSLEPKLKPIFKYLKKLTLEPYKLIEKDAQAVFEAGWSEEALYSAIQVCSLFCFMNRIIFGTGITGHDELYKERRESYKKEAPQDLSYMNYGRENGLLKK